MASRCTPGRDGNSRPFKAKLGQNLQWKSLGNGWAIASCLDQCVSPPENSPTLITLHKLQDDFSKSLVTMKHCK